MDKNKRKELTIYTCNIINIDESKINMCVKEDIPKSMHTVYFHNYTTGMKVRSVFAQERWGPNYKENKGSFIRHERWYTLIQVVVTEGVQSEQNLKKKLYT